MELGSHVSASGGVDKSIDRATKLEMTAFQIFTKNANQWNAKPLDPAVIERFRAGVAASPAIKTVVAHDSYLINIASPDDAAWEKSIGALEYELERCDQLDIPYLVSHPGAHVGSGVDAGVARVAQAINIIHEQMPDGTCSLALETTAGQGTTLGRTFEEIAQIIDGVDDKTRVSVCFDTCHVFAAGYDLRTAETYAATMQAFDDIIGLDRLRVLHLNDSVKDFGSHRDRHAHIGQGMIGTDAFQFLLRDARLAGRASILETPKDDDVTEDLMNLTTLRGLL
ncbi:MAG: deoxyribonuclease IV [Thermomicrobiales bacterium]|nr:deoxyribonuclease IV [Thermomicrobiales bacterium]